MSDPSMSHIQHTKTRQAVLRTFHLRRNEGSVGEQALAAPALAELDVLGRLVGNWHAALCIVLQLPRQHIPQHITSCGLGR